DRTLQVRCRSLAPGRASVGLLVNGQRIERQKIDDSFRDYTFTIPHDVLFAGRNIITFNASHVEFDSVRLFTSGSKALSYSADGVTTQQVVEGNRKITRLIASVPGTISAFCRVPGNSYLKVTFGLSKEKVKRGEAAHFAVFMDQDGKPRIELISR